MADSYTNNDIMRAIGTIEEKVDYAIKLGEKTNGRVTKLEKRATEEDAIERFKEKQEQMPVIKNAQTVVFEEKRAFFTNLNKLLIALTALATTVATYIMIKGGGL